MKRDEKQNIYTILAKLYIDSRKVPGFSHPYTLNELCLIGDAFTGENWIPNIATLSKYVKKLKKESETK